MPRRSALLSAPSVHCLFGALSLPSPSHSLVSGSCWTPCLVSDLMEFFLLMFRLTARENRGQMFVHYEGLETEDMTVGGGRCAAPQRGICLLSRVHLGRQYPTDDCAKLVRAVLLPGLQRTRSPHLTISPKPLHHSDHFPERYVCRFNHCISRRSRRKCGHTMRPFPTVPFFRLVPIDGPYSDEAVVRFTPPQYERVLNTEYECPAGILGVDVEICHSWDRVPSHVGPDRCSERKLLPVQPFVWAGLQ